MELIMEDPPKDYWCRSKIAKLIEIYKSQDCLWNVSNPCYRDKRKRIAAWKVVATSLGYDVVSVERKIKVLKTQFMHCYKLHKKYSMNGESYQPKWFAYNSLKFLIPGKIYRENREISKMQVEQQMVQRMVKTESIDITTNEIHDSSLTLNEYEPPPTIIPLGNTSITSQLTTDEPNISTTNEGPSERTQIRKDDRVENRVAGCRDEFDIFGELVACRVRKLQDARSRLTLQFNITNMIFDAEMQEIDRINDDRDDGIVKGM